MAKVAYLEDEGIKVARDMVKGTTWIHRSFLDSVTNQEATVWTVGGLYRFPSTANTLTLSSSSSSDSSSGTGARTVTVEGLNSEYITVTENLTMNGTSNVTTSNSYIRLTRATVTSAGSNETNVGDITVTHNGIYNPLGRINASAGQTQSSVYTIPKGKTGYLSRLAITSSKNTDGRATLRTRLSGVSRIRHSVFLHGGVYDNLFPYPTVLPQYTDVEMRCVALTGAGNMTGNYDILLVDNN